MLFRLLFVFLFVTVSAGAQTAVNDTSVFDVTEHPPAYPGGDSALKVYMREHARYPISGVDKRTTGTVYIRFIVEKDGTLTGFTVLKEITGAPDFTTEALRVTQSMSHWMPGRVGNKTVRCYVILPVRFVPPPLPASIDSLTAGDAAPLVHPEIPPSFPGGDAELKKYLAKNLVYPDRCKEMAIEGTVYISVMVETDGRLTEVKAVKEIKDARDLTKEAIGLVQHMPRWIPGSYNGTVVRMKCNIPVRFSLQ